MIIEREQDVTAAALAAMQRTADPRLREIMVALIRHLHGFIRDVRLTEAEFREATAILAEMGRLTTDTHNEFVLMSGSLGVSSLVCLLNNGDNGNTETDQSLLGPFWRLNSPRVENGGSIVRSDTPGAPLFVSGRVIDKDGRPDLVVLNGDNVDGNHFGKVIPAPRPQHGIRVFRNEGGLKFSKAFYYRMHGAIRPVVADFNGDGRPDIAAIALFPEWNYAEPETFVYLENQGGFRFEAQSLPKEFFSVWCAIEAADVNADGKPDIVLGLGNFPELVPPDWTTAHPAMQGRGGHAPSVIYLLNQG